MTEIGDNAFNGCPRILTKVLVSKDVKMGCNAFFGNYDKLGYYDEKATDDKGDND